MRLTTMLIAGAAGLAGVTGAFVGYQEIAPPASAEESPAAAPTPAPGERPARVRFRPCPKGFELQRKACVRTVVRTVVVPGAAVPAAGTGGFVGGSGVTSPRSGGAPAHDDRGEDGSDDHFRDDSHHGGDDHDDDHHGDDRDDDRHGDDDHHDDRDDDRDDDSRHGGDDRDEDRHDDD